MSNRTIENEYFFRNAIRSRDNWTCQKCGSVEYPQAHHINPVSDYPLFKNLPQYGITLCVYCHADAHPELPRNLFIANAIKAEKDGYISAGKLAKELNVNPITIVRKAIKLGILKPMQKWMFTEQEAKIIKENTYKKEKKEKGITEIKLTDNKVILVISNKPYAELKIGDITVAAVSKDNVQFFPNIGFTLCQKDIKQIYKFMENFDNAKQCEAPNCIKMFVPIRKSRRFCSANCRVRAHKVK